VSDLYFVKTMGGALKAADGLSEEYLDTLGTGEVIRGRFVKDRNPGHHRKFFGLLNLVFKNQEKYLSQEALRFAVSIQSGYVEEIRLAGDVVAFKPQSISWAKMDQTEFEKFYNAALQAIPRLLPQFEGVDLDRELSLTS
jgi:Protein of unknown function (DUF1367)